MAEIQDHPTSHVFDKFDGDPARCHPRDYSSTSEYQEEGDLLLKCFRVAAHVMGHAAWARHAVNSDLRF